MQALLVIQAALQQTATVEVLASASRIAGVQQLRAKELELGLTGIYPPVLRVTIATGPAMSGHFMDMGLVPVAGDSGPYETGWYDKRREASLCTRIHAICLPPTSSCLSD